MVSSVYNDGLDSWHIDGVFCGDEWVEHVVEDVAEFDIVDFSQ